VLDVVTLGETMVAISPKDGGSISSAATLVKCTAGAESNTAVTLAKLGLKVGWFSKLGADELGDYILKELRAHGVDTATVVRDATHPTGLMLKQTGVGLRQETEVFYYRKNSAAANMEVSELPLNYLKDARLIHLTGITPAISESCQQIIDYLFDFAAQNNILVSFDPNVRLKLWTAEQAKKTLASYLQRADIVMLGQDEAEMLLGVADPEAILAELFQGQAGYVAIKQGDKGAIVATREITHKIPPVPVTSVDTLGAGDAFNAGFLYGIVTGESIADSGKTAALLGALAVSSKGDIEGIPDQRVLNRLLSKTQHHPTR